MKQHYLTMTMVLSIALFFTSCDKDDPVIPNEEELITTLNLYLTPVDNGEMVTLSFQDLDGDGGNAPIVTSGTLIADVQYSGRMELLNESESPVEDITEEIEEEDDEHQFFFQSTISDLSFTYEDEDDNGNPVGLSTTLSTGMAGSGNITITLVHEPAKNAAGVSGGDITNAEGEIDIEVTFPIIVE